MLSLSQTTGYAVHALSCMTPDHPILIRDVAMRAGIHRPYLAKIINLLTRKKLLLAKRGYRGGVLLTRPAKEITLFEIVEAVEGQAWMGQCLLGLSECQAQQICPTHDLWQQIKRQICSMLQKITLADVSHNKNKPKNAARTLRCQSLTDAASVLQQLAAMQSSHKPAFGKGDAKTTFKRVALPKNTQPQTSQQLQ